MLPLAATQHRLRIVCGRRHFSSACSSPDRRRAASRPNTAKRAHVPSRLLAPPKLHVTYDGASTGEPDMWEKQPLRGAPGASELAQLRRPSCADLPLRQPLAGRYVCSVGASGRRNAAPSSQSVCMTQSRTHRHRVRWLRRNSARFSHHFIADSARCHLIIRHLVRRADASHG